MATNVIMPSLGFDMTAGKVARWVKQEGDAVEKGQPIAEIETEKATVEIEASAAGVLKKILVQSGETVPVGTAIGVIGEANERIDAPSADLPPGASPERRDEQATEKRAEPSKPVSTIAAEAGEDGRVKASPLARKMAQAAGLNLSDIKGTGPGGRIMERDVEAATANLTRSPSPIRRGEQASPVTLPTPTPAPMPAASELALSRMRQTIALRMTQSKTTAPHFYVTIEVNMDAAMAVREQLNNLGTDAEKISVNDLTVAAASRTLKKFPTFNASYHGDKLELHSTINVGIAVAVEDGLLTPTLHNADQKSLREIAVETKGMSERVRANKMHAEDLGPSTFTVSNLGMFGVDEFSAIINPPEAAILAVGAVTKRAIVVNEQIKIAQMMKATLSVDHRVADGAQAGRFLLELKKLLENPVNLLLP